MTETRAKYVASAYTFINATNLRGVRFSKAFCDVHLPQPGVVSHVVILVVEKTGKPKKGEAFPVRTGSGFVVRYRVVYKDVEGHCDAAHLENFEELRKQIERNRKKK